MKPLEQYKKFKEETPQLAFELEDKHLATLKVNKDIDSNDIPFIQDAVDFIERNAEGISELKYVIDFLNNCIVAYKKALENKEENFQVEVDLSKLKYCKTLLCYFQDEDVLSVLDTIQDEISESGVDEDRIFFFPENGYCKIRPDLNKKKEGVPVGDEYFFGESPLQYRWKDEDFFEVLYKGAWVEAQTIDFEFPFEHLRKI